MSLLKIMVENSRPGHLSQRLFIISRKTVGSKQSAQSQKGPPSAFEYSAMAEPNTKLMIAVSFMTMFSAGPEVSLSGSPTVSPVTEFLCASEPFTYSLPRPPADMYFLELSQAPPVLLMEIASSH